MSLTQIFFFFSGRELFLSDSSLFVDDAEAYEKYQREAEPDATEQKVIMLVVFTCRIYLHIFELAGSSSTGLLIWNDLIYYTRCYIIVD